MVFSVPSMRIWKNLNGVCARENRWADLTSNVFREKKKTWPRRVRPMNRGVGFTGDIGDKLGVRHNNIIMSHWSEIDRFEIDPAATSKGV